MKLSVQNTAKALAERVSKTFKFDDIVAHRTIADKNLYEMLGQYPGGGVGFKVWRKSWPSYKFIIIKDSQFKGLRTGKFTGVEYYKDSAVSDGPIRIRNCSKRGVWRYDINSASVETENGIEYSTEDLQLHLEQNSYFCKQARQQVQQD